MFTIVTDKTDLPISVKATGSVAQSLPGVVPEGEDGKWCIQDAIDRAKWGDRPVRDGATVCTSVEPLGG
jgi:hypothetical protein